MIKIVTKQEQKVVDVTKHYLEDAVAKEIALGLLSDELELVDYEISREYHPYDYLCVGSVMSEREKAVFHVKGYKVTIERG